MQELVINDLFSAKLNYSIRCVNVSLLLDLTATISFIIYFSIFGDVK